MAEFGLAVLGDVAFDLLPVFVGITDFFSIGADGQQAPQGFDMSHGGLQFLDLPGHDVLHFQDPATHAHPHLEFLDFIRFDDVIVGAGFQTFDDVFRPAADRQDDQVGGGGDFLFPGS